MKHLHATIMDEAKALSFANKSPMNRDVETLAPHLNSGTLPPRERNILTSSSLTKRAKQGSRESGKHQRRVDELRERLEKVIDAVLQELETRSSYAAVSKDVVALSTYKHSEQARLSDIIFKKTDEYFNSVAREQLRNQLDTSIKAHSAESFLGAFESWDLRLIRLLKLFIFLDRVYLLQHPKKKTIQEHGLALFASEFLDQNNTSSSYPKLFKDFVCNLHRICISRGFNKYGDLRRIVNIACQADPSFNYTVNSELELLLLSNYKKCRDDWWETPNTYVKNVFDNLRNDITFLKSTGRNDIAALFARKALNLTITSELSQVLSSCMSNLLEARPAEELGILVKFLLAEESIVGADFVKETLYYFGSHINLVTRQLIEESTVSGKNPLVSLIKLKDRYSEYCKSLRYFPGEQFEFEVRSSMSKAISCPELQTYCVQIFSKYCDAFFKAKESNFDTFKSNTLAFFKLMDNKTRILTQYERDFAKRLLLGKLFNLASEAIIVECLLSEVGESIDGTNLRGMIEEVKRCDEEFKTNIDGLEFTPLVLKKSNWPELPGQVTDLRLPHSLEEILSSFTAKFRSANGKSQYQNLNWTNYLLHQLTIQVAFDKGAKDIQVNLLQATVILLFQERDSLKLEKLQVETGMDEKMLNRVIASLSSSKYPLLIEEDGNYRFNFGFWDSASRIRLTMAREKESVVVDAMKKADKKSRNEEIRASIVQLLKENATMLYPELMGQILIRLKPRGEVHLASIKKNVEQLIAQEFIKRAEDGQTLVYIP